MTKRNQESVMEERWEKKEKKGRQNHKKDFGDWKLNDFKPEGDQWNIVDALQDENKTLVVVQGPSGTGKSSVVLWKALQDYKNKYYNKVLLVKNPTECGDDQLGLLTGNKNEKMEAHIHHMKMIFTQFMSMNKLENDMSNFNIVVDIPNFQIGSTHDHTIIILEEAQLMSPNTVKLLAERAGVGTKVIVVGDRSQRYAIKKRENGLQDLIGRVTEEVEGRLESKYDHVAYIELDTSNNKRSHLSRFITEIYE